MPRVSVIVPCFNEESTIQLLLEALYQQDFPNKDMEVVIADGLSTDATRDRIAEFQAAHPDLSLRVIDNPQRAIPAALNLAIAAAQGDIIIRLDAHCIPYPDYITRSLAALDSSHAWNVGGVWEIQPANSSLIARSIAVAASHPLGVGDAFYRFTNQARQVDTVPFGAFHKDLIARIGGFDESLLSNEDYEFNTRIRQAGGTIWLDPGIRSQYFARPSLAALARQYWRYGYWKVQMLRRYPASLRWRQAIPPVFVLSLLGLGLGGLLWPWLHRLLLIEVVLYGSLLLGAALVKSIESKQIGLLIGIPLAMATMHLSWGAAFLWSLTSRNDGKGLHHKNG